MKYLISPPDPPQIGHLRICVKNKKQIYSKKNAHPYYELLCCTEKGKFYKTYVVPDNINAQQWRNIEIGSVFVGAKLKWIQSKKDFVIDADSKITKVQTADFEKFYKFYVTKEISNQIKINYEDANG